jgi:predicted Zn finger-like uncharacterized protein
MIVSCPSCKRKYRLEDNRSKTRYQKLRCSKCGHIFVHEEAGLEERREEERVASLQWEGGPETEKRSHKRLLIFLICMVVLGGIAAGLYYYWQNYLGAGDRWLNIGKVEGQELIAKDGRVFFINGIVANGSTQPRKYILLRGKLFDKEGTVLGEQQAVAGMVLTREEIPNMRKTDLETKVNEFRLSRIETFSLDRKKEMPFSIVFLDGDFGQAKEFIVEITESPLQ